MWFVISFFIERSTYDRRGAGVVTELSAEHERTDSGDFGPDHVGSGRHGRSLQLLLGRDPGRGGQCHR